MGRLYALNGEYDGKYYGTRFQKWLNEQDCFSSKLSEPSFKKNRLGKSFQRLPKITWDVLGDIGIHAVSVADRESSEGLGRLLPTTRMLNSRGYASIGIAEGGISELSADIAVNYVFKDVFSSEEREMLKRVVDETHKVALVDVLGYSERYANKIIRETPNYWTSVMIKNVNAKHGVDYFGEYKGESRLPPTKLIDRAFKQFDRLLIV